MPIQSSGVIRFSDIQDEFGGSNPIALSEYYRGGDKVGDNNTSVPASGSVSLSDFYGTLSGVNLEILVQGAGGTGGLGYRYSNNAPYSGSRNSSGGSSSVSGNLASGSAFSVVGAGGLGGINGGSSSSANNGESGQGSAYGSGGPGQVRNHQGWHGIDASSNHYGAGGGGAGGQHNNIYKAGKGGAGGKAGDQVTLTKVVTPGSTLTVVVGARSDSASGQNIRRGGRGAGGYVKITHNGNDTTYTSPGTYTYTVPST